MRQIIRLITIFSAVSIPSQLRSEANVCDLSTVEGSRLGGFSRGGFNGRDVRFLVYPRWTFQLQSNGLVKVIETVSLYVHGLEDFIAGTVSSLLNTLPHDDCGIMIIVERNTLSLDEGAILVDVGYKGQLWRCSIFHFVCNDPNQKYSCQYRKSSIFGEGAGYVRIYISAKYADNNKRDIVLSVRKSDDFTLSTGTAFAAATVGTAIWGASGAALPKLLNNMVKQQIAGYTFNYPEMRVPLTANNRVPIKFLWQPEGSPFFARKIVMRPVGDTSPPIIAGTPSPPALSPIMFMMPSDEIVLTKSRSRNSVVRRHVSSERQLVKCSLWIASDFGALV